MKYTVLIIEDNHVICHGLESLLSKADHVKEIWVSKTAENALSIAEENTIDIAIVDISLPDMDGLALIHTMRQQWPSIKFIVLTSHSDKEHVLRAFSVGVHAYCTKTASSRIVSLVDDVAKGAMWVDPSVSSFLLKALTQQACLIHASSEYQGRFSPREQHILSMLAQGKNNQQIADDMHFSVHSVKVYLSKIFTKLGVEDRTQAAVKALQKHIITYESNS